MPGDTTTALGRFRADVARYPRGGWIYERSLWAIAVYRLGQGLRERGGPVAVLGTPVYRMLALLMQILTNIEIPASATIGPGLRIYHAGPIIVNAGATVGADCILNTGVILGNKETKQDVPTVGDRVSFGAGACVLGAVHIGNDVKIGAMTLVLDDVPSGTTVVGVPGRVIKRHIEAA
jgi:serine O-acetyltransferase